MRPPQRVTSNLATKMLGTYSIVLFSLRADRSVIGSPRPANTESATLMESANGFAATADVSRQTRRFSSVQLLGLFRFRAAHMATPAKINITVARVIIEVNCGSPTAAAYLRLCSTLLLQAGRLPVIARDINARRVRRLSGRRGRIRT